MDKYQYLLELYKLKFLGYEYIDESIVNRILLRPCKIQSLNLPNNYSQLYKFVQNCTLCDFYKTKKNLIFGSDYINQQILIMFIGDYPGVIEDESGDIFSSKSAYTLTQMITNVLNLNLKDIYYTHILKCKPSNTIISVSQVESCLDYLHAQIAIIKPKLIVTLGEFSLKTLYLEDASFKILRGQKLKYKRNDVEINMIPTFDPAFLIKNPSAKKDAMQDLEIIKSML